MVGMERGSIDEQALEGLKRGMSYGRYVAARFYPVEIVQFAPDGAKTVRSAPVPEVTPGWEETAARHRKRSVDGPCRSVEKKAVEEKKLRYCVVCGEQLRGKYRKYCSEECRKEAKKSRPPAPSHYVPVDRQDRPCKVCGKLMIQPARDQSYCSPECRKTANREKSRLWQQAHRPERKPRICTVCGQEIEGSGIKYCAECAEAEIARRNRERFRR